MAMVFTNAMAQTETQEQGKAGLEYIDVMPMPGMPDENGKITDNSVDVILKLQNPQLVGKAIVNLKPKNNANEILQVVEVKFFEKEGLIHYAIGKRERKLKRGTALVHLSIGELIWEQVSVEVILFDKAGVQVGSEVK